LRVKAESFVALSRATPTPIQLTPETDEESESGGGISLAQLATMLRAYWRKAVLIALAIIVLGAGVIKILPKSYTATATLKVDSDINDPLAGQVNQLLDHSGGYIATEMQLMTSNDVLLQVVDQLQLTANKQYIAGFRGAQTPENRRQWVRERLFKDLDVEQGSQGSLLISITATANNPDLAAAIANAVADIYLRQERKRIDDPANRRVQRYTEQLGELKEKVTLAADQLAAFKQRTGITDLTTLKSAQVDALTALEARLQTARATLPARGGAEGDKDQPVSAAAPRPSARVETLRTELATQESQLARLRATLGPRHPKILELESAAEATRAQIQSELREPARATGPDLAAARQLAERLQHEVEEQRAKVIEASSLQNEGNKYLLELDSAQSVYKRALDGYDQIMFASAGHYTYVDLVSHAVPPLKSTKPNKAKLFAVNVLAGLGLGLGLPLGYELFLNRRVRCRDDLERGFRVPVLVELDSISTQARSA
jgi:succinoglycan biosynthesis transport protein ExoP